MIFIIWSLIVIYKEIKIRKVTVADNIYIIGRRNFQVESKCETLFNMGDHVKLTQSEDAFCVAVG